MSDGTGNPPTSTAPPALPAGPAAANGHQRQAPVIGAPSRQPPPAASPAGGPAAAAAAEDECGWCGGLATAAIAVAIGLCGVAVIDLLTGGRLAAAIGGLFLRHHVEQPAPAGESDTGDGTS